MYYIAVKDPHGNYYIEESVEDWHAVVDNYEPIDCINGEVIIYDERGHKFQGGPHKELRSTKRLLALSIVDAGAWDFAKGKPFLIDTGEEKPEELATLLEK